jgi:hypothetical protein
MANGQFVILSVNCNFLTNLFIAAPSISERRKKFGFPEPKKVRFFGNLFNRKERKELKGNKGHSVVIEESSRSCAQSARGLAQSKTLSRMLVRAVGAQRLGVRAALRRFG